MEEHCFALFEQCLSMHGYSRVTPRTQESKFALFIILVNYYLLLPFIPLYHIYLTQTKTGKHGTVLLDPVSSNACQCMGTLGTQRKNTFFSLSSSLYDTNQGKIL